MTIIGNAAKWAILMPLVVIGIAAVGVCAFLAGYGFTSFITADAGYRFAGGGMAIVMAAGAFMGAMEASRRC